MGRWLRLKEGQMTQGAYRPDDVAVMQSVLKDWCAIQHISLESNEAVAAAAKIVELMYRKSWTKQELLEELQESQRKPH